MFRARSSEKHMLRTGTVTHSKTRRLRVHSRALSSLARAMQSSDRGTQRDTCATLFQTTSRYRIALMPKPVKL